MEFGARERFFIMVLVDMVWVMMELAPFDYILDGSDLMWIDGIDF